MLATSHDNLTAVQSNTNILEQIQGLPYAENMNMIDNNIYKNISIKTTLVAHARAPQAKEKEI